MTGRDQWPYWMAVVILLGAVAVLFWRRPEVAAEIAPARPRAGLVLVVDESALNQAESLAQRLAFRSPQALLQETASDAPPVVSGVIKIGRRGFAYVEGGEKAGRVAVGQSVGGWTLTGVGGNYAEFSRAGETRQVRLFTQARPVETQQQAAAQAQLSAPVIPPAPVVVGRP